MASVAFKKMHVQSFLRSLTDTILLILQWKERSVMGALPAGGCACGVPASPLLTGISSSPPWLGSLPNFTSQFLGLGLTFPGIPRWEEDLLSCSCRYALVRPALFPVIRGHCLVYLHIGLYRSSLGKCMAVIFFQLHWSSHLAGDPPPRLDTDSGTEERAF